MPIIQHAYTIVISQPDILPYSLKYIYTHGLAQYNVRVPCQTLLVFKSSKVYSAKSYSTENFDIDHVNFDISHALACFNNYNSHHLKYWIKNIIIVIS